MYNFGQTSPIFTCVHTLWMILSNIDFTCLHTLWLIPNNIHFTCFLFCLFLFYIHLHFQCVYYRGRGAVALFLLLKFSKIFQVLANVPQTQNISEKSSHPFYKSEIKCLQIFLLLFFIEIGIQKRHFSLIQSEKPTTKVTHLRFLTTNVLNRLKCLQTFFQSCPDCNQKTSKQRDFFKKVISQELEVQKLSFLQTINFPSL